MFHRGLPEVGVGNTDNLTGSVLLTAMSILSCLYSFCFSDVLIKFILLFEQEEERRREEKDERKRKYNVKYNDEVHLCLHFVFLMVVVFFFMVFLTTFICTGYT